MGSIQFNPFEDRLSRDIRNDLSETIIGTIENRSLAEAEKIAASYRARDLSSTYTNYIDQRLKRYGMAVETLKADSGLLVQAAVLWDLGLFFEVHEILEPAWMEVTGDEKRLLQALIRAAGVYINLELGYRQRAEKIGAKTVPVLKELQEGLADSINAEALIAALETLSEEPPQISVH